MDRNHWTAAHNKTLDSATTVRTAACELEAETAPFLRDRSYQWMTAVALW
jgi:hypothetical protein